MKEIEGFLHIAPKPAPRMNYRFKNERAVAYLAWKKVVRELALKEGLAPGMKPVKVRVVFYMEIPTSWNRAKKTELQMQLYQGTPDLDNLLKGFLDACFDEDKSIARVIAEKRWAAVGGIEFKVVI